MEEIAIVLTAILIASLLNIVFKRFRLPTAIGYIVTGCLIAQLFGYTQTYMLEHISEIGIILLMFTIGLEFSFEELQAMKREVFFYGVLQMLITSALFAFLLTLFSFSFKSALIIGSALALSSTAIVLKILNETGSIHAGYGRKALGILLFQDIAVIPILMMIDIFTKDISLSKMLFQTVTNMLLFFLLLYFVGKYLIDKYLQYAVTTKNQEIFLLAIFFIVLFSAQIAHFFGFSYSLGAFFAGMLLAESHFKYQIEADLAPFRDLLLGVFFFSVGERIDIEIISHHIGTILLITVGVMLTKAIILYGILSFFEQKRTALKSALALSQIGEFALAIFLLAQNNHLINATTTNILSIAVILSMIFTPLIIQHLPSIADRILKEPENELKITSTGLKNHIMVCGYGPLGQAVAHTLKKRGFEYIIIEHDLNLYQEGINRNEPIFFGNAAQRSILEALNVHESCAVVITFHNLEKIRLVTHAVLDLAPHAHIVTRVRDKKEKEALSQIGIDDIVVTTEVLSKTMINKLFYCPLPNTSSNDEDYSF